MEIVLARVGEIVFAVQNELLIVVKGRRLLLSVLFDVVVVIVIMVVVMVVIDFVVGRGMDQSGRDVGQRLRLIGLGRRRALFEQTPSYETVMNRKRSTKLLSIELTRVFLMVRRRPADDSDALRDSC